MLIEELCDVYNYADDNSIGFSGKNTEEVISKLRNVANVMVTWFNDNFLQANPEKFQFIMFNDLNNDCILSINNSVKLVKQEQVKLLGVTIDSKLTFTDHINGLCIKAGKHLNMLKRLSNMLNQDVKYQLFNTFILSHFNFCSVIWHFCSMADMKKIENVQKRALRIVFNDYTATYAQLRERANKPLMYVERIRNIVLAMFKIYHGLSPISLKSMIKKHVTKYEMHNVNMLMLPNYNTVKYGKNTFKYFNASIWNKLPNKLRAECNFKTFKNILSEWNGPNCFCSYCQLCSLTQM